MAITQEDIDNRFTYHPTKEGQQERYVAIRNKAKELAMLVVASSPASCEQSLAITKLEECVMWTNAAIARKE